MADTKKAEAAFGAVFGILTATTGAHQRMREAVMSGTANPELFAEITEQMVSDQKMLVEGFDAETVQQFAEALGEIVGNLFEAINTITFTTSGKAFNFGGMLADISKGYAVGGYEPNDEPWNITMVRNDPDGGGLEVAQLDENGHVLGCSCGKEHTDEELNGGGPDGAV